MATDTIKSFLVQIGYKHDEVALKKITTGIESATKAVAGFGLALTGIATTVAWSVTRIASNLEGLYFASVRTGSSATHLKAFDMAAQRMGANAGEGLAAAEKLAAYIRSKPPGQARSIIETLFPGASVDEKDPVKTLESISAAMQRLGYFQSQLRGKTVGIDEGTTNWMYRFGGSGGAGLEAQMAKQLGPNFEKAVEGSHRFENSLAVLQTRLEGFGSVVLDVLEHKFGWSLDKLSAWLDKNGAKLAESLGDGITRILDFAAKLWPAIETLLGWMVKLNDVTGGWSTVLIAVSVVMPGLVTGVLSLSAAFATFAVGAAAKGIGALSGVMGWVLGPLAAAGGGYALGSFLNEKFGLSGKIGDAADAIGNWWNGMLKTSVWTKQGPTSRAAWMMDALEKMGWSPAQAAGLAANAMAESSMDPMASNKGHRGLFQWDAARWGNFERLAKTMGWDVNDPMAQLQFANQELRFGSEQIAGRALLASNSAGRSGYVVSHAYERPGSDVADNLRAGIAARLDTTINVNGVQDPIAVTHLIEKAQALHRDRLAATMREFAAGTI